MIFKDKEFYNSEHQKNGIYYLTNYHPYRGGSNPEFNDTSKIILDFKDKKSYIVQYLSELLADKVISDAEVIICVVPSHSMNSTNSGIQQVAEKIIQVKPNCFNGLNCLKRIKDIDKLSRGGPRGLAVHLESIIVQNKELIWGKEVLLLDDVATSGNSMLACKQLLLTSGAKDVLCLAIAYTSS